jgi:hypothetical protein
MEGQEKVSYMIIGAYEHINALMTDVPVFFLRSVTPVGKGTNSFPVLLFRVIVLTDRCPDIYSFSALPLSHLLASHLA